MNKLRELLDNCNIDALFVSMPSNIRYATGYLADYCYVLITKSKQYYFTDGRFIIEANRDLSSDWQVLEIVPTTAYDVISKVLVDNSVVKVGFDSDIMYRDYLFVERLLNGYRSIDVTDSILELRAIKSAKEVHKITLAQRIAEKSLDELKAYLKVGVSEREIAGRLEYFMRLNGADVTSFDTIVAFGENSAIAHAKPSDRKLKFGDIILIDFGAKLDGYCSDMTRCFVYGEASDKVKDMYDSVLRANELAIESVRCGIKCSDLDKVARDYLDSRGYKDYFIHSLGHGVGVDIHEAPNLSMRANDKLLVNNMVVTIEPGVYIDGVGGIRIEDMIVVSDDKAVNLTTSNKNLEIINN